MTYDIHAHRQTERAHCLKLVREGGIGWHEYVKDKAKRLAERDPGLHADLPSAVAAAIAETAPQRTTTNRRT